MRTKELATARKASASDRKALAILAYDRAQELGDGANWRAVADMLRECLPATRVQEATPMESDGYLPWADYAIPTSFSGLRKLVWPSPRITVTFADGEVVRCQAATLEGKPVNIGRGVRVAIAFYRNRMWSRVARGNDAWFPPSYHAEAIDVPGIISIVSRDGSGLWNAVTANDATRKLRAGIVCCAVPRPVKRAPIVALAVWRKALESVCLVTAWAA